MHGHTMAYMATVDCSVPAGMLTVKVEAFDEPNAFGVYRTYFLQDVRVARYQQVIRKINQFQKGEVDPGFDISGKDITYPVQDSPDEFVSIIEARLPGTDTITNRGVAIQKKHGALAEMSQGSF